MTYLTKDEFKDFGFDEVEEFEKLLKRAEIAINLFLNSFYSFVDFEKEIEHRKQAVKLATAFQIATILDASWGSLRLMISQSSLYCGSRAYSYHLQELL